jgi:mannose-6-phosphate isomerase-like protein (cupin superfamily)
MLDQPLDPTLPGSGVRHNMALNSFKNNRPKQEESMATVQTDDIPEELSDKTTKTIELRGAAKKEAFFRKKEEDFQPFSFKRPDDIPEGRRAHVRLAKGSILRGTVQVLPSGGDTNVHCHPDADGFWFVIQGCVEWYNVDGELLGSFKAGEGILVPRYARYRFNQAGDEELHLLQVVGSANDGSKRRVGIGEQNQALFNTLHYNYPEDE